MVKRTGSSCVKGAKHYESKAIPHFRNGGEVGGIGGGAGAGGSSIGGAGGNGSVAGGNSRGAGNGDVRGSGVSSSNRTGTTMSNARPEERGAYMTRPTAQYSMPSVAKAKPRSVVAPTPVAYGMKPAAPRLTGFPGGYGVLAYDNPRTTKDQSRVSQDPSFNGNTFDQDTRNVGVSSKDQSRVGVYFRGGSVKGKKK